MQPKGRLGREDKTSVGQDADVAMLGPRILEKAPAVQPKLTPSRMPEATAKRSARHSTLSESKEKVEGEYHSNLFE